MPRLRTLVRRGAGAYARTLRTAPPNAKRYFAAVASVAFVLSRLGQALPVASTTIVALGLVYGLGDGVIRSAGAAC